MPAPQLRVHLAALLGYTCVALLFAWPLPVHLSDVVPRRPLRGHRGLHLEPVGLPARDRRPPRVPVPHARDSHARPRRRAADAAQLHDVCQRPRVSAARRLRPGHGVQPDHDRQPRDGGLRDVRVRQPADGRCRRRVSRRAAVRIQSLHVGARGRALQPGTGGPDSHLRPGAVQHVAAADPSSRGRRGRRDGVGVPERPVLRRLLPDDADGHGGAFAGHHRAAPRRRPHCLVADGPRPPVAVAWPGSSRASPFAAADGSSCSAFVSA